MYGDVGCGKTMLMDLFLEALPSSSKKKRVHFNGFMQQFHQAMHRWRETPESRTEHSHTAIEKVTDQIIEDSKLLCFDEFQVTNIADAMMMGRLFRGLWKRGAVVVTTSNRPPDGPRAFFGFKLSLLLILLCLRRFVQERLAAGIIHSIYSRAEGSVLCALHQLRD